MTTTPPPTEAGSGWATIVRRDPGAAKLLSAATSREQALLTTRGPERPSQRRPRGRHNHKTTREIEVSTKIRSAAAAASCLAVLLAAGTAAAHQPKHHSGSKVSAKVAHQLHAAKRATAKFRDVHVAENAGYEAASPCVAEPGLGGMGFHYAIAALEGDAKVDLRKPEVLVYAPTHKGGLRLVALEYLRKGCSSATRQGSSPSSTRG